MNKKNKKKLWKKIAASIVTIILLAFGVDNFTEVELSNTFESLSMGETIQVEKNKPYNELQEVVDYLHLYDELPPNYLTKEEAKKLGWDPSEGNLRELEADASIGGDYFGNFEGNLPEKSGRDYYEADIDYEGGYRNSKRLVYSTDDLYFYTEDHYKSFDKIEPGGE